jgi:hypothetical protein
MMAKSVAPCRLIIMVANLGQVRDALRMNESSPAPRSVRVRAALAAGRFYVSLGESWRAPLARQGDDLKRGHPAPLLADPGPWRPTTGNQQSKAGGMRAATGTAPTGH